MAQTPVKRKGALMMNILYDLKFTFPTSKDSYFVPFMKQV